LGASSENLVPIAVISVPFKEGAWRGPRAELNEVAKTEISAPISIEVEHELSTLQIVTVPDGRITESGKRLLDVMVHKKRSTLMIF
jgi:hypothetical protein